MLLAHKDTTEHDNDLAMVCYLCTIYEQEKADGQDTIFDKAADMEELLERYTALKFYLRRIDFGVMEDMESFYWFLSQNQVSSYELLRVADFCAVHKEKVLRVIGGDVEESSRTTEHDGGAAVGSAERRVIRFAGEEAVESGAAVRSAEQEPAGSGAVTDGVPDAAAVGSAGEETVESGAPDAAAERSAVDRRQFCFILCTNDPVYAAECIYYINRLNVPEGMEIDVLTVEDARSMTAGYNEAMACSQAKYKVYLHHDTFIINPNFIRDCLDIFEKNPQIGMIGNVGVGTMPASGVMWDADRYGMLYEQHIYETELLANAISASLEYMEVDAVDGFLMVTQYDIPWREDLFDKWDFYDCSQSMEFIRRGYRVVVPGMKEPWCVHDCGFIDLKNYDSEREKFIREYLTGRR